MVVRAVEVETGAGVMRVHECRNPVRDRGAVIVLQEALGANDHLLDLVARVGAAGYHAVAPELYHRSGVTRIEYGDYDTIYAQIAAVDDETFLADVDATIAYLRSQGWQSSSIGAVGFNLGGRVSFLVSAEREIGASVGFYGAGIAVSTTPKGALGPLVPLSGALKTPWLGLYGEKDRTVSLDDIALLERELAGQPARIVRFAEGGHAFHSDARPELYVPRAAREAWRLTLEWFESRLELVGD